MALDAILDVFAAAAAAVVSGNVAIVLGGSGFGAGGRGLNWWELGRLGGVVECCLGRWGWQSCSVECVTRSDEHVRTTSCDGLSWAVDSVGASFTAG